MDPITILSLASAGLSIVEQLAPKIQQLFASGEITPQQQADLMARYAQLLTNSAASFAGSEWTKSDGTPSGSQTP